MKKIIIILCLLYIFPVYTTFGAYKATANDAIIISSLTNRINTIIERKGEKNRDLYVRKLADVKGKIKKNERYTYIVEKVIKNITPSMADMPSILHEYFNEIDSVTSTGSSIEGKTSIKSMPTSTISESNSSEASLNWIDIREYQISRDNIFAEKDTQTGFLVSCYNFSDKWEKYYIKELENYITIAEKNNNNLLLQLMKTDFTGFEKYFKEKCKTDLKSITSKIKVGESVYDELGMKTVYYEFKQNFVIYLENFYYSQMNNSAGLSVYCTAISDEWSYFDFPRLKMIQQLLKNQDKKDMLELFGDIEEKIRKVYKEYCKVNKLAS